MSPTFRDTFPHSLELCDWRTEFYSIPFEKHRNFEKSYWLMPTPEKVEDVFNNKNSSQFEKCLKSSSLGGRRFELDSFEILNSIQEELGFKSPSYSSLYTISINEIKY